MLKLKGKKFYALIFLIMISVLASLALAGVFDDGMKPTKEWVITSGADNGSEGTLRYAVQQAQTMPEYNHYIRFFKSTGSSQVKEVVLDPSKGYIEISADITLTIDGMRLGGFMSDESNFGATKIKMNETSSSKSRIFDIRNGNLRFNELVFENGDAAGETCGGAMSIIADNGKEPVVKITGCTFRNNKGGQKQKDTHITGEQYGCGGAMYILNHGTDSTAYPVVNVINTAFINNEVPDVGRGGGAVEVSRFYSHSGLPQVRFTNCLFDGNKALSTQGYGGGAICNDDNFAGADSGGHVIAEGCTFVNNKAYSGGAILSDNGSVTELINCTFSGNESTGTGNSNMGVIQLGGKAVMTNCTVVGNKSVRYGAVAVDNEGGDLTLANNIIVGNVTGSAPYGEAADLYVTSSDVTKFNPEYDTGQPDSFSAGTPARLISRGYNLVGNFRNDGARAVNWLDGKDIVSADFSASASDSSFFLWLDVDQKQAASWKTAGSSAKAVNFTKNNYGPMAGGLYDSGTKGLTTIGVSNGYLNGQQGTEAFAYEKIPADNVSLPETDQRGVKRIQGNKGEIGALEMIYASETSKSATNPKLVFSPTDTPELSPVPAGGITDIGTNEAANKQYFLQTPEGIFKNISTYFRYTTIAPEHFSVSENGIIRANSDIKQTGGSIYQIASYWNNEANTVVDITWTKYVATNEFNPQLDTSASAHGVSLMPSKLPLKIGEESILSARDGSLSNNVAITRWSSDNDKVATVDMNGKVRAINGGSAEITAVNAFGEKGTCQVQVAYWTAESVTVFRLNAFDEPASLDVEADSTGPWLLAEVLPDGAKQQVSWQMADGIIASVNSPEKMATRFRGLKVGGTTLSATAADSSVKREIKINVTDKTKPNLLTVGVTPEKATLQINKTLQLTAKVTPSGAEQKVTWESSDTQKATVDENGLVTAGNTPGEAVITAKTAGETSAGDNLTATCTVTVTQEAVISGVEISAANATLRKGASVTLSASVAPADAEQKITWSSDNPDAAAVSSNGEVTAVAAGSATIKAASAADPAVYAICLVSVYNDGGAQPVVVPPVVDVNINTAVTESPKVNTKPDIEKVKTTMGLKDNTGLSLTENGEVLLSQETVNKAAGDNKVVSLLPVVTANITQGKIAAIAYSFKGGELGGAQTAKDIKLLKMFPDGTGKPFNYATLANQADMAFALLDSEKHEDFLGDIASGDTYTLVTFIADDKDFDLDKTPGQILDPVAILESKKSDNPSSGDGGSGGGCSAGYGLLALLAIVPATLRRKKN